MLNTRKKDAVGETIYQRYVLRIPRGHIDPGGIWKSQTGDIQRVQLIYSLPSGRPAAYVLSSKIPKPPDDPLADDSLGRFMYELMFVGPQYEIDKFVNQKIKSYRDVFREHPAIQMIPVDGLARYRTVHCLSEGYLKSNLPEDVQLRERYFAEKRAAAKPDDPSVPDHCKIERYREYLFTPGDLPENEKVFIECIQDSCRLNMTTPYGLGGTVRMPRDLLPRWREVKAGTARMLDSFASGPVPRSTTN